MRRFDIARFMSNVQGGNMAGGQMDRWHANNTQMVEDNVMGRWGGGRVLWSF